MHAAGVCSNHGKGYPNGVSAAPAAPNAFRREQKNVVAGSHSHPPICR